MNRFLSATALALLMALPLRAKSADSRLSATPASGLYDSLFQLSIAANGETVLITTNGSAPSTETARKYAGPILITNNTIVRAAVVKHGEIAGPVVTRTYLFPQDIIHQSGAGFPSTWGTNKGKPVPADYAMDPQITFAPEYRNLMEQSLKAIPSVSLVMDEAELFGEAHGIYDHPEERGAEWERAGSFEFIPGDGKKSVQVNCGVRIQGGWNRRPEESPKHSFRLIFKKKYGPGKLHYPLFGNDAGTELDSLILRAGCNNTWLHWSGTERHRGEFIRDQWMRDTLRAMGHPSAAGLFVHLYLNGLYWGLYNLTERPDAAFAAEHFGGSAKKYDAFNADKVVEGDREAWNELMKRVNAGLRNDADFERAAELLDIESFIDYMIVNFYGANADWDRGSNWYAARRRGPGEKFHFFIWDAERTLEQAGDNTMDFDDDESPTRIFHRLAENEKFRQLFSDRVRRHFASGAALSAAVAADRYRKWADTIDLAVIAESARWGDYRRDVHPYKEGPYELYTRNEHWRPEVNRLLNEYFPRRSAIVLKQFEARGFYSPAASPDKRIPAAQR
jgi:hypothetical protein